MSSLMEASFAPPLPVAAAAPPPPSLDGVEVKEWAEKYHGEEPVLFQIIAIGDSTHVWIGSGEAAHNSLALAMPATREGGMPTGTTLLGAHADTGAQRMAQRLTKRLGRPILLSLNVRDEPELRQFAEATVLKALRPPPLTPAPPPAEPPPPASAAATAAATTAAAAAAATTAVGAGTCGEALGGVGARVVEVFEDGAPLAERAAALLVAAAAEAIAERGRFVVALSGGSSERRNASNRMPCPRRFPGWVEARLHAAAPATAPPARRRAVPALLSPALLAAKAQAGFGRWHVLLADERHVAEEDADSNLGAWRAALLDAAGVPAAQRCALDASLPLEEAALQYETALLGLAGHAAEAGAVTAAPPTLDCVVLGMGPDGHTASLFPGHALLAEERRAVAPIADSPKPPARRVTLTLPVLNAARLALFVATGQAKAANLKAAFEPDTALPAGLVLARRTVWLADAAAAADYLEEKAAAADALYG